MPRSPQSMRKSMKRSTRWPGGRAECPTRRGKSGPPYAPLQKKAALAGRLSLPYDRPCAGITQIRFNGSAANSRPLSPVATEHPDTIVSGQM